MKLFELTATEAIAKITKKEISLKELIDSFVERIEKIEPMVQAWAYFNKEIIYRQVEEITAKIDNGTFKGHFFGVPIGVKDVFNTKDMPTRMGSRIYEGFTPGNDARTVHNARMEGAVIMGKTVTAEFAVHYPGPTNNPYNFDYFPGTSSTGSAVAVATAMAPLTLGTQTAGSIIRPASYCGVYGYKPSFGLLPRTGILKTVDPLDQVGFFARSVDDLKLLLDALRVKGINYPFVKKYLEDEKRQQKTKFRPWKIAFLKTHLWPEVEQYNQKAILAFVKRISALKGISVKEEGLSSEFTEAHSVHDLIYDKALSYYFKEEYEDHRDLISDDFKNLLESGRKITHPQYLEALEKQNNLASLLDIFLKDYDAILTFSTAGEPPRKDEYQKEKPDACLIWTLCRVPSINLPGLKGPGGLPLGIQVISRRYNDYLLLSLLEFLEQYGIIKKSEIVL